MKTYWDHTEKERSEMSDEQVSSFLDYELMEQGVLKPAMPQLAPVSDPPVKFETWYTVTLGDNYSTEETRCIFDSLQKAEAFAALAPHIAKYDWQVGQKYSYPFTGIAKIVPTQICNQESVNVAKVELAKNRKLHEANQKAQQEYDAAVKASGDASEAIWEDWRKCCGKSYGLQRVVNTFAEYRKLAGSDDVAIAFLRKAYRQDQIDEANEWFAFFDDSPQCVAAG